MRGALALSLISYQTAVTFLRSTYHPLSSPQWLVLQVTKRITHCFLSGVRGKKEELFVFSELLGKLVHGAAHPSWVASLIHYLNKVSTHCISCSSSSDTGMYLRKIMAKYFSCHWFCGLSEVSCNPCFTFQKLWAFQHVSKWVPG